MKLGVPKKLQEKGGEGDLEGDDVRRHGSCAATTAENLPRATGGA
jgi:hypothetical protein